jgi:hypothetical protein
MYSGVLRVCSKSSTGTLQMILTLEKVAGKDPVRWNCSTDSMTSTVECIYDILDQPIETSQTVVNRS